MKLIDCIYNLIWFLLLILLFVAAFMVFMYSRSDSRITIGFSGDVMIGRFVNTIINNTNYSYPWGNVLPLLKKADLNIANLETTLTKSEKATPKVFNFKATPDKVQALIAGNIDIVNLANNHILDFGVSGLKETIKTLNSVDIKHVGAGLNNQAAQEPVITTKNNIRIGIIGLTDNEPGWQATKNKPGINYINLTKDNAIDKIRHQILSLKSKVDLCIVSIHWGPNKVEVPSEKYINFAHDLIDLGVDIIHGHSAHLIQGIEIYKNKVILYSTGDFIDDYATYSNARNDLSFYYLATCSKNKIHKVTLYPVKINLGQVNLAQNQNYNYIVNKVISLSKAFGTHITESDNKLIIKL